MGITVNEMTFATISDDESIELPIFQRGKVWSDGKKFGLVLSAVLNYPVGAISVLSEEVDIEGTVKIKNHLLDGQQRTDAIQSALQNPSLVLTWAKNALNLEDSASVDEIALNLKYRTLCYFGAITPKQDENISEKIKNCSWDKGNERKDEWVERKKNLIQTEYETAITECNFVTEIGDPLTLIPQLHQFSQFLFNFKYRKTKTGENPLSALLLKKAYYTDNKPPYFEGKSLKEDQFFRKLGSYRKWLREERKPDLVSFEDFQTWWLQEHGAFIRDKASNKTAIKARIHANWDALIKPFLKSLKDFTDMYGAAKIGKILIENDGIRKYNTYDMMRIFDLINTQGEPLSLVEILAAKYYWREKVTCSEQLRLKIQTVNQKKKHLNFITTHDDDGVEILDHEKLTKWHIASCYYDMLSESDVLDGVLE